MITVNYNYYGASKEELAEIKNLLLFITKQNKKTMADLTDITREVEENTSVTQSAVTLLNGLKAALDAAGTDPVALKALSDSLSANSDALAAAVAANTIPA